MGGAGTREPRDILCLNTGSSSLKFALFAAGAGEDERLRGAVTGLGAERPRLRLWDAGGRLQREAAVDARAAVDAVPLVLEAVAAYTPAAVGHRLVHGGPDHVAPARLDAALLAALRRASLLAPLHLPAQLAVVEAVAARRPELPQVACFDTAFHSRLPAVARRLPLPRSLDDEGVRRYGFHGLSYEYVVEAVGQGAGRLVIAHLGSGASLAAVRDGAPVDTTMSLTPSGGIMMGTRSGDLDPGVLVYLLRTRGWDADAVERFVNQEAGLLGVSGRSADMEALLAARDTDAAAAEAVAVFCWQARKAVGALAAALGGLDTLVFTGGIGEHAAPVRAGICDGLAHLGIRLDAAKNAADAPVISVLDVPCTVRVVPTDEDRMIARHTRAVLA